MKKVSPKGTVGFDVNVSGLADGTYVVQLVNVEESHEWGSSVQPSNAFQIAFVEKSKNSDDADPSITWVGARGIAKALGLASAQSQEQAMKSQAHFGLRVTTSDEKRGTGKDAYYPREWSRVKLD